MKNVIAFILALAIVGGGCWAWHLYDASRYEVEYKTVTVGFKGTVYAIALHYLNQQDRYDLDEFIYYICDENGLHNSRYLFLQPSDVLRVPLWKLKGKSN